MKTILNKINQLFLCGMFLLASTGCSDDNRSDLRLEGDTWLTALTLDGAYEGVINRTD